MQRANREACESLESKVEAGPSEGPKHDSAIHRDGLASVERSRLTDYVGSLSHDKLKELDRALKVALDLD